MAVFGDLTDRFVVQALPMLLEFLKLDNADRMAAAKECLKVYQKLFSVMQNIRVICDGEVKAKEEDCAAVLYFTRFFDQLDVVSAIMLGKEGVQASSDTMGLSDASCLEKVFSDDGKAIVRKLESAYQSVALGIRKSPNFQAQLIPGEPIPQPPSLRSQGLLREVIAKFPATAQPQVPGAPAGSHRR